MENHKNEDKIERILNDPKKMEKIIQSGINSALRKHQQAGNPICVSENGKVVWIEPENIFSKKINLRKYFNVKINNYHTPKIYIDFLEHLIKYQKEGDKHFNHFFVLKGMLSYDEHALLDAKEKLIKSGYIRPAENSSQLYLTEAGENYYQEYHRFAMQGLLNRLTILSKKNLYVVSIILGSIVAIITILSFLLIIFK